RPDPPGDHCAEEAQEDAADTFIHREADREEERPRAGEENAVKPVRRINLTLSSRPSGSRTTCGGRASRDPCIQQRYADENYLSCGPIGPGSHFAPLRSAGMTIGSVDLRS